MISRSICAALSSFCALFFFVSCASPQRDPNVTIDEFAGTSLSSQWTVYNGKATNGNSYWRPAAVSVGDGILTVTGTGDQVGGMCWCGPNTPDYAFGDYEFKVRIDAGDGYIPVLLLWPDAEDWPIGGEIDALEIPAGDRQEAHATLHYSAQNKSFAKSISTDFTQWSTVKLEWRSDHIRVLYNDKEVLYTEDRTMIPQRSMHPVIQLDVNDKNFGSPRTTLTPQPLKYQVDSVKFTKISGVSVPRR